MIYDRPRLWLVNGMVTVAVDPTFFPRHQSTGEERRDRRVQVLPSQRKAWYLEINPDSWEVFRGGLIWSVELMDFPYLSEFTRKGYMVAACVCTVVTGIAPFGNLFTRGISKASQRGDADPSIDVGVSRKEHVSLNIPLFSWDVFLHCFSTTWLYRANRSVALKTCPSV